MVLGNALLRGEKVYLNKVTQADAPLFGQWFANLDLLANLNAGALVPLTEVDERKWIESLGKENHFTFAIRTLENNDLLGTVSLQAVDWHNRCSEVGIAVGDPRYWGKGYGSDAMQVMLRYAFYELNLHRIELRVYSYNARAVRSYEKVGFRHEGSLRQAFYRDGAYHDIHVMAILQDEWQALAAQ